MKHKWLKAEARSRNKKARSEEDIFSKHPLETQNTSLHELCGKDYTYFG